MEFNTVKAKLNLLYTGSLLIILVIFITILYVFISGSIKNQEVQELDSFFEHEEHELVEEIWEGEYRHLEFKPERNIFFYIYDQNQRLIEGEETARGLFHYIEENNLNKPLPSFTKEIEWEHSTYW